jgi:WD40 repeat protein
MSVKTLSLRGLAPAAKFRRPSGAAILGLVALIFAPHFAIAQTAIERDLVRIRADEESRPWLSINAGGHTAGVNALAFSPDGTHLYSGGLDKTIHVWDMSAAVRDLRRGRLLERSIRWPVNRGLRGSIYTLAVAPMDRLLAVAGYGASNETGEIWLIDPRQGTLTQLLRGHRQAVMSLAFSPDGNWLASLDASGKAIAWRRGQWQPSPLYADDTAVYGAEAAKAIAAQPQLRPLAIAGSSHVVLPVFVQRGPDGRPRWKLQRINLANRKDVRTFDTLHAGMVTALAATADGKRLASADLDGNLFLWDLSGKSAPRKLAPQRTVLSLAFTLDGRTLLAGTALGNAASEMQLWDVAAGKITARRELSDHVRACTVSPDGRQLAYSGAADHAVSVATIASFPNDTPLGSSARRVIKVAFAKDEPIYRLAFGTQYRPAGFNNYGPLERSFDTQELNLSGAAGIDPSDWLAPQWAAGAWSAEVETRGSQSLLQLYRGGQRRGYVNIQTAIDGKIRCYGWLPGEDGQPLAVAVGTDLQNSIYVCRVADEGACPILRHFRGHFDYVTSLAVSRDVRYLASASADGTVRVWSLSSYLKGREAPSRWGAEFTVEGGKLVVKSIDLAGPLYFKGVREGDELKSIAWPDEKRAERTESTPATIVEQLQVVSWQTQVLFRFARNAVDRPPFQLLPAWQPLVNLFVNNDGEWAFWTPEGYYDASPNGHTLFGWQVNRGLQQTPDFYRADQFRKNLERPDVLERLLPTGSLNTAMRQAMLAPPPEPEQLVAQQVLATPRITIASPLTGEEIDNDTAVVRAVVDVPPDGELVQAKAFANGIVARERRLIDEQLMQGQKQITYEWQIGLPAEQRVLVQVVAGTAAQTAALSSVVIERAVPKHAAERLPKLYLLAVGVDHYRDPAIQPLAFAVADAQSVADLFRSKSPGLFNLEEPIVRVNEQVTRAQWTEAFSQLSEKLKADARADDLFVIFMAGHGFVDPQEQRYYFASQDISADDVLRGEYTGSISWKDFELLADVPCRKLAFLDTCHSGAIQPLRDRDLKAAIRALQEDVVLTVAASAGHERSEENAAWGHGAFTKTLIEGLSGAADISLDGSVSLDELIYYVKTQVPKLTAGRQNPAAAPDDLLRYVSLRLTEASDSAKVSRNNVAAECDGANH